MLEVMGHTRRRGGGGAGGWACHPYHISVECGLSCWSTVVFGIPIVATTLPFFVG